MCQWNDNTSKAKTYVYNGSANIAQNGVTDSSFVMRNSQGRLRAFIIISSEATSWLIAFLISTHVRSYLELIVVLLASKKLLLLRNNIFLSMTKKEHFLEKQTLFENVSKV